MDNEPPMPLPVERRIPCKKCGFMQDPDYAPPIREFCTMCSPPEEASEPTDSR